MNKLTLSSILREYQSPIKFGFIRKKQKFIINTKVGPFKEGEEIEVYNISYYGNERVLHLKNNKGLTTTIKGDPGEEIDFISKI
jgi:hypothetical protein